MLCMENYKELSSSGAESIRYMWQRMRLRKYMEVTQWKLLKETVR